ncbi:MAG: galactokinase, partial [Bacteroidota bacterium]
QKYKLIGANLGSYRILLLNSNITHELASSEYNTRRLECDEGVAIIKQSYPDVNSLRDVDRKMLEQCSWFLDSHIFNRCSYVVSENIRVKSAVNVLKKGDLKKLGFLLYESHLGLRNLYEVSCPELDFLVDISKNYTEVLGARLMGGGFGGCTINLVHVDFISRYVEEVCEAYYKRFKIELTPIEVSLDNGTQVQRIA